MRKKSQWNSYRSNNVNYVFLFALFIGAICLSAIVFDTKFSDLEKEVAAELQITQMPPVVIVDATDFNLAVSYIKQSETFQPVPYRLGIHWYIGYGHQIKKNENFKEISKQKADDILHEDLMNMVQYASVRYNLFGSQALAVGLLFYNVRHSSICSSVMDSELKKGPTCWDEKKIQESWAKLCRFENKEHAGLRERREFEIKLFFGYGKH